MSLNNHVTLSFIFIILLFTAGCNNAANHSVNNSMPPDIIDTSDSSDLETTGKDADYSDVNSSESLSETTANSEVSSPKYIITDSVPAPNPDNYKTLNIDEVSQVNEIIEKARNSGLLMQDEPVIFKDNVEFAGWGNTHYYYDDSIMVIAWREMIDGKYMTFAEIKISDVSQFRRKLADDVFNSKNQYRCSELSKTVNSVISMNADYYQYRNIGTVVYNGVVERFDNKLDTLFIDGNGDFKVIEKGSDMTKEVLKSFVADNNISFSLSFGPLMIKNGELIDFSDYTLGENSTPYSRTCICQVDTLHYLYANAGYMSDDNRGATSFELANIVLDKGVKEAYMMDGGQTSEVIFNNKIINLLKPEDERMVSDIIYFATAISN